MDSPEYEFDEFAEVIATLFPICVYAYINVPKQFIWATSTPDEPRIAKMFHRLGYRKSAELYTEWLLMLVIIPTMIPILVAIAKNNLLKTTSFGFIYLNTFLFAINQIMVSHIIDFFCDSEEWAERLETGIEILNIFATLVTFSLPTIEPYIVYTTSILPLPAITWMTKLGIIASNKGIDVDLYQRNVIVNGNDMTSVMYVALGMVIWKFILIVYMWPIKINNDE